MSIFKNENEKICLIRDYMSSSFNDKKEGRLGPEIEHIMVDKKRKKRVFYPGADGVEGVLNDLLAKHPTWKPIESHERSIGIKIPGEGLWGEDILGAEISLEPGGQFEISLDPSSSVQELKKSYLARIRQVYEILDKRDYGLLNIGLDPINKALDVPMIPKDRYRIMDDRMSRQGRHARTMMRLSASFQVSIDVFSREDFLRKYRILAAITPLLYSLFDNSPYYEGHFIKIHNARQEVWRNVDPDRTGLPKGLFEDDFSIEGYAAWALKSPPLFYKEGDKLHECGDKNLSDLLNEARDIDEAEKMIEHGLSIIFPDIRMKKIMEIRSMDSLLLDYSFAAAAMIKGLFYSEENLKILEEDFLPSKEDWIRRGMDAGRDNGLTAFYRGDYMVNWGIKFLDLAKKALPEEEGKLLDPLRALWDELLAPRDLIFKRNIKGTKMAEKDEKEIFERIIEKCEVINALS